MTVCSKAIQIIALLDDNDQDSMNAMYEYIMNHFIQTFYQSISLNDQNHIKKASLFISLALNKLGFEHEQRIAMNEELLPLLNCLNTKLNNLCSETHQKEYKQARNLFETDDESDYNPECNFTKHYSISGSEFNKYTT